MVHSIQIAAIAASLLLLPSTLAEGLYSKGSPVLQVTAANYDNLIAKSNYTSIIEFYAPWCGHCQNLKPAYEKAAKSLTGLGKVAAVNCDDESNKMFCGNMAVKGFPTLKIVRPGKKHGRPIIDDYEGQRTAKAIVDAVIDKIPNHVKRLKDSDFEAWLEEGSGAKAMLFSDKGTTSALLKAIAIDFLGAIDVAQVRNTEKQAVGKFNVAKFPSLVLLPGDGREPVTYSDDMKKDAMVAFLSQAAAPNPDPPVKKSKKSSSSKTDKAKASKASSSFSKASESQASSEAKTAKASQTMESMEDQSQPTESPGPNMVTEDTQKPIKLPEVAPPITTIQDEVTLQHKCLNSKSGTCILALLPEDTAASPNSQQAVSSLSEIHHKHEAAKRNLFPFYQLPSTVSRTLQDKLKLSASIELIALNGKRSWYRHYVKTSFTQIEIEDWIDSIRMGEGSKEKVPSGLIVDVEDLPPEPIHLSSKDGPQAMKEALKAQMPEGVDFEFEEINDDDYERIIRQASADAKKATETAAAKEEESEDVRVDEHDEL